MEALLDADKAVKGMSNHSAEGIMYMTLKRLLTQLSKVKIQMSQETVLNSEDVVGSNEKQLLESPEIEAIATKIFEKHDLDLGPAEIGYFLVYPNLSKKNGC